MSRTIKLRFNGYMAPGGKASASASIIESVGGEGHITRETVVEVVTADLTIAHAGFEDEAHLARVFAEMAEAAATAAAEVLKTSLESRFPREFGRVTGEQEPP